MASKFVRAAKFTRGGMTQREQSLGGLLGRIGQGDHDAMQELFQQERSSLMRLFVGLCGCSSSSEDLVQGTFIALWKYRSNYRGGSASSYLYRVAVNQWRRASARERRAKDALKDYGPERVARQVTEGDDPVEREETRAAVWRAIEELPEAQRETFVLHRFEGMSCPQIAETIDKSVKTVESRLRLALEKLTEKLQKRERLQ